MKSKKTDERVFGPVSAPSGYCRGRARSRQRQRVALRRNVLGAESLERRQLLAADVTISFTAGLLQIEGTEAADAFILRQDGPAIEVSYVSGSGTAGLRRIPAGVSRVEIVGGAGRDLVVVRNGSFPGGISVSGGAEADLVISRSAVTLPDATAGDVFLRFRDAALLDDLAITTRRVEAANFANEATYAGKLLRKSETWTADGQRVELAWDGTGVIAKSTFVGSRLALSEIWDTAGGYQRTFTPANGSSLSETFRDGVRRIEEKQSGAVVIRTTWDDSGFIMRQSMDGENLLLEEAWDGKGAYRRTWSDASGRGYEEAFDGEIPKLRAVTEGDRQVRNAWGDDGNRVREVTVAGVLQRRDQWDREGRQLTTTFSNGQAVLRDTFVAGRQVQREAWTGDQLIRTAWNESNDRLRQTLIGDRVIREAEIKATGETRVTEWLADKVVRTSTDSSGNCSIETLVSDVVQSRELRLTDGGVVLTTFDPATGKPVREDRTSGDKTQTQTTEWFETRVVRRTTREGVLVAREVWKDGGLIRTMWDGSGNKQREAFEGSDRESLAEGTKVSEGVTAPNGDQIQTTWEVDGTKQTLGVRDGTVVMAELIKGDDRQVIFRGTGGYHAEVFVGSNLVERTQSLDDGTYQTRKFTNGVLTYEYCVDRSGRTQKTTWYDEYTGNSSLTGFETVKRRLMTDGRRRLSEVTNETSVTRTMWTGDGTTPDSTYYREVEYLKNAWWMPMGATDTRREIKFYDSGTLVYLARVRVDGNSSLLVNTPSAAWDAMQAGRFGLTGSDDIFALSDTGGTFNLGGVVGFVVGTWKGENPDNPITIDIGPIRDIQDGLKNSFADVNHAIDVNLRNLGKDLQTVLGGIDFSKLKLPSLEGVNVGAFAGIGSIKWSGLDSLPAFKGNPFAKIGSLQDIRWENPRSWVSEKWNDFSKWLAKVDPIKAVESVLPGSSNRPRKVQYFNEYLMELHGYTRDQALLIVDLVYAKEPGLRGRFLAEYNALLAQQGQKVYQRYFDDATAPALDGAGHAALQQTGKTRALNRLLSQYGLNPDGTKKPVAVTNPGMGLEEGGDIPLPEVGLSRWGEIPKDENGGGGGKGWNFDPTTFNVPPPKQDAQRPPPSRPDSEDERKQRKADEAWMREVEKKRKDNDRVRTSQEITERFPTRIVESTTRELKTYAAAKGKEVATLYDAVEQTLRIGGSFGVGFSEGAVATVEGLGKSIVAALDADTWKSLGTSVRKSGRDFMNAKDKSKFVADFGNSACSALEDGALKMIDEWEKAGPEDRARMIGKLAGQVATDAVLNSLGSKIMQAAGDAALMGRKTKAAVDKVAEGEEFVTLEIKVKARVNDTYVAAPGETKARTALNEISAESMRKKLREEAGMDPEHARRLAGFSKEKQMVVVVKGANVNSLQYQGKKGYGAKPVDLKLKTNESTGLVTASRQVDGALFDARGKVVAGYSVRKDGWIVGPDGAKSNYRLDRGHVVDAKGTKFYSDYDVISVDAAPLPGSNTWTMVSTGDATTGPGRIVDEMNAAILGPNRKENIVMHGANRENVGKTAGGIYQILTPDIKDTFVVADFDGTIYHLNQAATKDFLKQRNIPWEIDGL